MIAAMEQLVLRAMTTAEFHAYRARLIPEYAEDHVRAGDWSAEQAEDLAARQIDELLPAGPGTPRMLVLSAETADGGPLGLVWVGLDYPRSGDAWVYDIQIVPQHRGKGYGRALLQAAEQECARRGAQAIGLNVFGANTGARSLYESSGYEVTAVTMRKELGRSA